jgi:hypothetical protein
MKRENQIHFHQSTKTLLISFAYLLAIGASKEAPFIFNFQCEDQVLWRAAFYKEKKALFISANPPTFSPCVGAPLDEGVNCDVL